MIKSLFLLLSIISLFPVQNALVTGQKHRQVPFVASNDQISSSISNNAPQVVFLGDSIVDRWRDKNFFPGKPYLNAGVSGDTTKDMLDRFKRLYILNERTHILSLKKCNFIESVNNDVVSVKPIAVIIAGGGNDILDEESLTFTIDNIKAMVNLALANGIKVILPSITPACNYDIFPGSWEALSSRNEWIKNFCKENNIVYLDYFSSLVNKRNVYKFGYVTWDCIHPTRLGYSVMAPLAEKAIEQTLKGSNRVNLVTN